MPSFSVSPCLCGALLLFFATTINAAEPAEPIECRRAEGKIVLDGKAADAAWKNAQAIETFGQPWQRDNARDAKTTTKAKLLWDDQFLYFHAEMEDHDLYADIVDHDGQTWDNDVFELFFKTSDKERGYYEFQASAAGTKMDMFLPSRGSGGYRRWKAAHDFAWDVKVVRSGTLNNHADRDEGWQVEGRFPWKDFAPTGGRPQVNEVWKFALCRYDYSIDFEETELSTCAPLQQLSFHRYEDYLPLKFVK